MAILRHTVNVPQNELKCCRVKDTPYMLYSCYLCPWVLNFSSFRSTNTRFWVYGQYVYEKCSEWPQMVLNTTRTMLPHICCFSTPQSQISITFAIRHAVLEWKVHEWPQNGLKGTPQNGIKGTPYICFTSAPSPRSISPIRPAIFVLWGHFETSALNDP